MTSVLDDLKRIARRPIAAAQGWRLPGLEDRVTINGKTGSGKTVAGAWLLSQARFDVQPFIVLDFKEEKLFNQIARIKRMTIDDALPSDPGLYLLPMIDRSSDEIEDWLWTVWRRGKIGLFVDEGYLLPDKQAWRALLVTGRSRKIPLYTLSQRPVKLPRFTISESNFYMLFHLNDKRDRKTVSEYTPDNDVWNMDERLKPYHSRWYDMDRDFSTVLKPVPHMDRILAEFDRRLTPRRTLL